MPLAPDMWARRLLDTPTPIVEEHDDDASHLWVLGTAGVAIAGCFAWLASFIALYQIIQHLKYYDDPVIQRYYIRIIFLIPNLALSSFFSLAFPGAAEYIETVRDMYEAFVIYTFMALLLEYIGGAGSVESFCVDKVVEPSWIHGTCCLPAQQVNGQFVRTCKQMVLQFVVIKPILAAITIVLYATGKYTEGDWSPLSPYLYIQLVYNVCYAVALLGLLQFYLGTKEPLRPYKPLMKFVLVKLVVFLTFWQGLFLSIVFAGSDHVHAKPVQNWLICFEMFPAAIGMLIAFPYSDYKVKGIQASSYTNGVAHVISIGDVVQDIRHQFVPMYRPYTCYSSEEGGGLPQNKKPTSTYRAKTFIMQDTDQRNIVAEVKEDIAEKERRTTDSLQLGAERGSTAHLTGGGGSDSYYPRASVADFVGDDREVGFGLFTTPSTGAQIELGERQLDLLGNAEGGPVGSSAPAVYKGNSKHGRGGEFDDIAL